MIEQRTAHVQTGQWAQASCTTPAALVISEFRLRGAAGGADEYVELYNNSDSPVTVCTTDGSGGWTLAARSAGGSAASPVFTLPAGTTIPARALPRGERHAQRRLQPRLAPGG